ncbi:MAG: hypothetical protein QXW35_02705 [Candidatus Aenigmatarchaeota archaeon]
MRNILLFTILFLIVLNISFSGIALINDTVIVEAGKNTTFCFFVFSKTGGNITIITPKILEEIFDKVYLTNKSFILKPYTEVCNNIDCVFNELCYKKVQEYCKLVCYIFYKEKTNEKYWKEYNSSVTILINNMFSESLGYKIILKNDLNNFDIIKIFIIVAFFVVLLLLIILKKIKFL